MIFCSLINIKFSYQHQWIWKMIQSLDRLISRCLSSRLLCCGQLLMAFQWRIIEQSSDKCTAWCCCRLVWKLSSQFARKSCKVWEISCWSADQPTDMSVDDTHTLLGKLLSLHIAAKKETCFLTLAPVDCLLTSWTTSPRIPWWRNQPCGCIRIRYYARCTYSFCHDAPHSTQYASPQSAGLMSTPVETDPAKVATDWRPDRRHL